MKYIYLNKKLSLSTRKCVFRKQRCIQLNKSIPFVILIFVRDRYPFGSVYIVSSAPLNAAFQTDETKYRRNLRKIFLRTEKSVTASMRKGAMSGTFPNGRHPYVSSHILKGKTHLAHHSDRNVSATFYFSASFIAKGKQNYKPR